MIRRAVVYLPDPTSRAAAAVGVILSALPLIVGLLALGSQGYWLTCLARGVARR